MIKRCCHRLERFCKCPPDAPVTCPICTRPISECPGFEQHVTDQSAGRPL